jgi:hypothetical protein
MCSRRMGYPTSGTGVVKYAINGAMIFNYTPTASEHLPTKPKQVKLTPGYMNRTNVKVQVDDLEVLDHIPCAEVPCGPPTHVAD